MALDFNKRIFDNEAIPHNAGASMSSPQQDRLVSAAPAVQHTIPSYLDSTHLGPWGNYLQQVDRVAPYLGSLSRWIETLKRPKRILIVDVPIELDNGTVAHFE